MGDSTKCAIDVPIGEIPCSEKKTRALCKLPNNSIFPLPQDLYCYEGLAKKIMPTVYNDIVQVFHPMILRFLRDFLVQPYIGPFIILLRESLGIADRSWVLIIGYTMKNQGNSSPPKLVL